MITIYLEAMMFAQPNPTDVNTELPKPKQTAGQHLDNGLAKAKKQGHRLCTFTSRHSEKVRGKLGDALVHAGAKVPPGSVK